MLKTNSNFKSILKEQFSLLLKLVKGNSFQKMDFSKSYAEKLSIEKDMVVAPAAERNKQCILDVLKGFLPTSAGKVLEIASGPGQHVTHFASDNPHLTWQPSDMEEAYLKSIRAHIVAKELKNVLQPVSIDITKPVDENLDASFTSNSWDFIYNANMVHISPWETSIGLFKTAGKLLKSNGILFMYGPFKLYGNLSPESNVQFDSSLQSRNPTWGIRDVKDLEELAKENGLKLEKMIDMPANNKSLIFRHE